MVMIDMGDPCPIQWNQPASVDCSTEDVLWHEFSLVPRNNLLHMRGRPMVELALADVSEPFMVCIVGIVAVLEPLFDEHVG